MITNEPPKMVIKHHLTYGQHYYYPVNDLAKKLLEFVRPNGKRKVFTADQIEQARNLGMTIEIIPMDSQ